MNAPVLEPQFRDHAQQDFARSFGMWVFLSSELLFFGPLLYGYLYLRMHHPEATGMASRHTDMLLGTVNTAVLLTSSFCMALAGHAAQKGNDMRDRRRAARLLALTAALGIVFLAIKWAGVAYLAFLAWRFWTSGITPETIEARKARGGLVSSFIAGLTVTLGNPKTMIFYLAITPTIVDLKTITLADYAILAILTVAVLFVVLVPYLALAAKARWFLKSPRALKALNRTAAGFMMGAAAAIAARQ